MNSLPRRIIRKLNHYLNLVIGKCVDALTRIGLYGKVPFTIEGSYGDVIQVTHPYPANYDTADKLRFDGWKQYQTFPHDLHRVQHVLLTSDGIVLKKLRTFIPALPHPIFRNQFGLLYNLRVRLLYTKMKAPSDRKYLLVYDNWSWNNYFHWVIDTMCRLQLVNDHVKENFTIILPKESPQYMIEILNLYGYRDIIRVPEKSAIRVSELYSMNYAAWSGQQHPEILKNMLRFTKNKIVGATVIGTRRVYVSRSKARSRRVANEAALLELLHKYNFEILHFEGMSFRDQIIQMQDVKYLVSSHGANLTNIVWLPENARVLELIRQDAPNFCYWSVASSIGLNYNYQLCTRESRDHITVDLDRFEKNLLNLLAE
jgi:hypothetical protein